MNDDRTESQKYQHWVNTVNQAWSKKWMHAYGWVLYSPSGSKHDLSAADLTRLDQIEADGLFSV